MNNPLTIVTHGPSVFHVDELMAIALLKYYYLDSADIVISRTRDPKEIALANIAIDVGGIYNPATLNFDHHQFEKSHPLYGLSSAGLVVKFLEDSDTKLPPKLKRLIKDIDDQDTGIKRQDEYHLCNIVSAYNKPNVNGKAQEDSFYKVLSLLADTIHNYDIAFQQYLTQMKEADKLISYKTAGVRILYGNKHIDYIPTHLLVGKADILVAWDNTQRAWTVSTIPLEKDAYGSKYLLESTKASNEIFVHNAGFIGKYKENEPITFKLKGKKAITIKKR